MIVSGNHAEAAATLHSPARRAGVAMVVCWLLFFTGCHTASLEAPILPEGPPAAVPRQAGAPAVLGGVSPGVDRAAWSHHLRRGREHLARKRYVQAETEFSLAMDLAEGFGPTNQRQITSLVNLELVARRYTSAEDLIRISHKVIPIAARLRGESDASVAAHLTVLAGALVSVGKFEEARPYLTRALSIYTGQRGMASVDSPEVAQIHLLQSAVERGEGNLQAAEDEVMQALEVGERIGGPDHLELIPAISAYAQLLIERDRRVEAEAALVRANRLGSQAGWSTYSGTLNALAWFYTEDGQLSEAEALATQALELTADRRLPNSQVAAILDTLGSALLRQEKYSEAEVHLARAYEFAPEVTTPPYDQVRAHYAQLLRATNRESEAKAIEAPTLAPTPSAAEPSEAAGTPPPHPAKTVGETSAD